MLLHLQANYKAGLTQWAFPGQCSNAEPELGLAQYALS
jgi:hypothetical protein